MAKLQIDGIEIAQIDAARAVRVLRLVRENGPGMVIQPPVNGRSQEPPGEVLLPLVFAQGLASSLATRRPRA